MITCESSDYCQFTYVKVNCELHGSRKSNKNHFHQNMSTNWLSNDIKKREKQNHKINIQ